MARNGFAAQFIRAFGPAADRAISQMRHQDRMELKARAQRLQRRNVLSMIDSREARTRMEGEQLDMEQELQPFRVQEARAGVRSAQAGADQAETQADVAARTADDQVTAAELANTISELQVRQGKRALSRSTTFTLDEDIAAGLGAPELAGAQVPREVAATLLSQAGQRGAINAEMNRTSRRNLPTPPPPSITPRGAQEGVRESQGFVAALFGQGADEQGGTGRDPVTGQRDDLSLFSLPGRALGAFQDAMREPLDDRERAFVSATLGNVRNQIQQMRTQPMRPDVRSRNARAFGMQLEVQKRRIAARGGDDELIERINRTQQRLKDFVGDDRMRRIQDMTTEQLLNAVQEGDIEAQNAATSTFNAITPNS